ncbi:hypothetical protein B0H10DRAFT_2029014 [Mycena sp. CBHHK59/15]|nr:hypothetical protein B0H10DRAFT_2029014 [Mycena sp. CBHHK59/15]
MCLELSEGNAMTVFLSDGDFPLYPPVMLSGKAQERIWLSSFELDDLHDILTRYASQPVHTEIPLYDFCRPGGILFLPGSSENQDSSAMPMSPGGEVAHIPNHQFQDSGWTYDSRDLVDFKNTCTEMGDGWIRFWFPRFPHPCKYFMKRTLYLASSREETWDIEAAWLSQAHHIFARYGIEDDLDSYAFIEETAYSVSLLNSGRSSAEITLSGGIFLFICPIGAVQHCSPPGLLYPVPAYWSLEPSGSRVLLPEDAATLGAPTLSLTASVWGYRWNTEVYRSLAEFHQGKGFNPDSHDVALHRGLPLYQSNGVYAYVELVNDV